MKKIFCISLIAIAVCGALSFGMVGVSTTSNHNSVPMSSQEMQSSVGTGCIYLPYDILICYGNDCSHTVWCWE